MFDYLKTGIDGLDAILGGGIRYPADRSCFVFVSGGPGSGKTVLGLELLTRAWLGAADGMTMLYYSVEHAPQTLHAKLEEDFDFYGLDVEVVKLPEEVPHKVCLEARHANGGKSRLVLTQADTAGLEPVTGEGQGRRIDVDWILAEIGNYHLGGRVGMVCIDNVGLLLTDLDYFGKRAKLLETRKSLMAKQIHGLFVHEETDPRDLRLPSAEEFSTDVLIQLSFKEQRAGGDFKARNLEILKARHQYYYRGNHHFSIAGRGIRRDVYLGARNERGPGIHIYPSVAAQLSIARDRAGFTVPKRGEEPIDLGHPDLQAAFAQGLQPTQCSSTVLVAEPGTRYTYLSMRFLAASRRQGKRSVMVSTKEDREALLQICGRDKTLRECLASGGHFHSLLRVLYLHPEYISSGKFTWDILRVAEGGHVGTGQPSVVDRLAFDNIYNLPARFPLVTEPDFVVRTLLDLLRYRGVTPLFVDLVPPGKGDGSINFDPAVYMTTFDNVVYLYRGHDEQSGDVTPHVRVLKSTALEDLRKPLPLKYDRP